MAESLYSIGNSLTENGVPGFASIAAMNGATIDAGYHIRYGAPLSHIQANPNDVSLDNSTPFGFYGTFNQALSNNSWNYVTIEPFPGTTFGLNDTLGSDMANIAYFIDLTKSSGRSSDAEFFIYEAWPTQTSYGNSYQSYWNQPVSDSQGQPMVLAKQYFDTLYAGLNAKYSNAVNIKIIPIGNVLNQLDINIKSGLLLGINDISDLYSDDYHVNNIGRFVAAITVYATILKTSPENINIPTWMFATGYGPALTVDLAHQLETVVWDVVSHDPRTGVAPVPIPAATWLFGSALAGIAAIGKRTKPQREDLGS